MSKNKVDFFWGAATSSYQIEGAHDKDGRTASIWDTFTHRKKINRGENADNACDHYHRYNEDIDLMKNLNLNAYRFSVSWSRVLNGQQINQPGVDFYNRLIDGLLKKNITPFLTLYHWDLPEAINKKGGWTSRDITEYFSEYAALCADKFGDRVNHFMTLNEPMIYNIAGYLLGIHAPGIRSFKKYAAAVHHSLLAQGKAARILKEKLPTAVLGTVNAVSSIQPASSSRRHQKAAEAADAFLNRTFIEPVLGYGYPEQHKPFFKKVSQFIKPGDLETIKFDFDFWGINNYSRMCVKRNRFIPFAGFRPVRPSKKSNTSAMGWEIYPDGIYQVLKKYNDYKEVKSIIITENGMALEDRPEPASDGRQQVADNQRIDFYREYIGRVLKAKQDGIPVDGYFAWSLLDNFEWAEGYRPRFGLIYIDFETGNRLPKNSYYWYRDFIKKSG